MRSMLSAKLRLHSGYPPMESVEGLQHDVRQIDVEHNWRVGILGELQLRCGRRSLFGCYLENCAA